jgi:lysylphosphatidylglycerol synthetase-like protein (DUF2156 family)
MTQPTKKLLYWTPRVLGLAFAAFISLFALDVFGHGAGFWQTLAALLIHMIPTLVVLAVVALAWRWEWIGAVVCLGLAVAYIADTAPRFHWSVYLAISGPLFLVGILFGVGWVLRKDLRPRGARLSGTGVSAAGHG